MSPEPAWFTSKVDQRLALMEHKLDADVAKMTNILLTPLTEPEEGATAEEYKRWDSTCDGCGKFVHPKFLITGHTTRELKKFPGVQIIITFGACGHCMKGFST